MQGQKRTAMMVFVLSSSIFSLSLFLCNVTPALARISLNNDDHEISKTIAATNQNKEYLSVHDAVKPGAPLTSTPTLTPLETTQLGLPAMPASFEPAVWQQYVTDSVSSINKLNDAGQKAVAWNTVLTAVNNVLQNHPSALSNTSIETLLGGISAYFGSRDFTALSNANTPLLSAKTGTEKTKGSTATGMAGNNNSLVTNNEKLETKMGSLQIDLYASVSDVTKQILKKDSAFSNEELQSAQNDLGEIFASINGLTNGNIKASVTDKLLNDLVPYLRSNGRDTFVDLLQELLKP